MEVQLFNFYLLDVSKHLIVLIGFAFCQALPIFLDGLVKAWVAILISVTLILLFGEVSDQLSCNDDQIMPNM